MEASINYVPTTEVVNETFVTTEVEPLYEILKQRKAVEFINPSYHLRADVIDDEENYALEAVALKKAKNAINGISKAALQELKAFLNPPQLVKLILDGVMQMVEGKLSEDPWKSA